MSSGIRNRPTVARRQEANFDKQTLMYGGGIFLPSSNANDRGTHILTYDRNTTKNNSSGRQIALTSIKIQPRYRGSSGTELVSGVRTESMNGTGSPSVGSLYRNVFS